MVRSLKRHDGLFDLLYALDVEGLVLVHDFSFFVAIVAIVASFTIARIASSLFAIFLAASVIRTTISH